ncbi:hypothetical protein JKP88DRAFT_262945 [Tribonema minus]|uniref:Uncharacterized protein n=1 Tax=Tribonema minus TaxID=303371 RepID=A0A836CH97_9STRA|nr:hypothetical protein JKP88DRAFT_262945 [Tribonema minus]
MAEELKFGQISRSFLIVPYLNFVEQETPGLGEHYDIRVSADLADPASMLLEDVPWGMPFEEVRRKLKLRVGKLEAAKYDLVYRHPVDQELTRMRTQDDLDTALRALSRTRAAALTAARAPGKLVACFFLVPSLDVGIDEYFGLGREGVKGRAYITKRELTCQKLLRQLKKVGFMMVKAPPESGKTSLLQLFGRYLTQEGIPYAHLTCIAIKADAQGRFSIDDALAALEPYKMDLHALIAHKSKPELVLLIDEGQILYDRVKTKSELFWASLKHLSSATRGGKLDTPAARLRVLMAASYGTQGSDAPDAQTSCLSATATPISILPEATITIFPPVAPDGVSLQLDDAEYQELWTEFFRHEEFQLGKAVQDYVYDICGGQAGLVCYCLDYLAQTLKNGTRVEDHVDAHAMYRLISEEFLLRLNNVRSLQEYRAAPYIAHADALLRRLLWEGPLLMDMDASTDEALASRKLHKRGLVTVLPDNRQALGANGFVDFFVSAPYRAAVELTRDGHNLRQHLQRFRETSKYKPMFDGGVAKSFAVLDVRSPGQSRPQFRDEHLWTVLMDADFQSATMYHGGSPPKKLKLIGDAGDESRNALRAAAARFG